MPLAAEHCRDLPKGSPPLPPAQAQALVRQVPHWQIVPGTGTAAQSPSADGAADLTKRGATTIGATALVAKQADRLVRMMRFKDFVASLAFLNEVAAVAEAEGHHPDLHLTGYRDLKVELSTHSVGGLSRNDFILAAKVDALPGAPQ